MKFGNLLGDNLRNSPERKAPLREGLKRCCRKDISVATYTCGKSQLGTRDKIVVAEGVCPPRCSKEFQKSWEPETKAPRRETLSAATRCLKFENYLSLSHSVQIRIRWDVSLRYWGYKQTKVGFIWGSGRPRRRRILKTQEKRELGKQEEDFQISFYFSGLFFPFLYDCNSGCLFFILR